MQAARRRGVRPASIIAICIALLLALLQVGQASAIGPYPSPPPDFAHPGSPHDPLYSPTGGDRDRPVLVIYAQFNDVTFPSAFDAAAVANRFFGPFPSVANYYANDSFGRLILSPATETNTTNNGAVNDGVVSVTIASNKATFTALSAGAQNKQLLQAADPFVNFAAFDTNGNGALTDDEIVIEHLQAAPVPIGPGCGATRGVDPVSLDGKNMNLSVAMDGIDTNLMTIIHETGHVSLHTRDLYGFGVGSLDLSGPTCGPGDALLFRTSAWQKMHVGWIAPTVVVKDGYYSVDRADSSGAAFILYDPSKGTDDYFIVENRQRTAATYDQSASDSGLVIWRIDDAQYNSGSESIRPIDIMRPDGTTNAGCGSGGCYGGSNGDAWNPSDGTTPQRTMARTWRDGTAANVAVRAIGPSGNAIRAYFDVRGPGVLVDPTTATGVPIQVDVTPDEANPVSFAVMNTGETSDNFNFTVGNLPIGWASTTDTKTLGAGTGSVANILVTVPADAPTGISTVKAIGTSATDGTITTQCSFTVNVVLHQTAIAYTGPTSVPFGEPAGFRAQVSDITNPSDIVVGATVTFQLSDGTNTQIATAVTDGSGVAAVSPALTVPPGNYTLSVSVPRSGKHAPAATSVAYTVERRPTALVYTGDTSADYSDPANLSATLTDALSGTPIPGMPIALALGSQTASATTDGAGVASQVIVVNQPAGNVTVSAAFAGDTIYLPSSDSKTFTIAKEKLTFVYTGDTLVELGSTPTLAAVATQEADGSPGDLSLATATFHMAPTLTSTPFDYTTGVDASGQATTPASGLPVDLWTITVSVPDSNPYWQGASAAPAELALYDPAASITGGAHGRDSDSHDADATFTGRYHQSSPQGQVQLRSSAGRFKGSDFAWIIAVGDQAIFEVRGDLDGAQAILRLRMRDAGEPGVGHDTFAARLTTPSGSVLYESGTVRLDGGNLQVRTS